MKTNAFSALVIALCIHWMPAQAQPVYRCGGSYGNQPCPGGVVVPTEDPRSAAQRAQTDAAVKRDAQSAKAMEKERLKQEAVPAQAIIPPAAPQPVASEPQHIVTVVKLKAKPKSKAKKPEFFTAIEPKQPGAGAKKQAKAKAPKKKAEKKSAA